MELDVRMWSSDRESYVERTIVITRRYCPPILSTLESMLWFEVSDLGLHD